MIATDVASRGLGTSLFLRPSRSPSLRPSLCLPAAVRSRRIIPLWECCGSEDEALLLSVRRAQRDRLETTDTLHAGLLVVRDCSQPLAVSSFRHFPGPRLAPHQERLLLYDQLALYDTPTPVLARTQRSFPVASVRWDDDFVGRAGTPQRVRLDP